MSTKNIYQAYTYFVKWSEHDRQYYGVRYTQELNDRSPEEDLWIEYFSSSPHVKEFREKHGEPDIILIDQKFDNPDEACDYEVEFLQENNVVEDERWLNRNDRRAVRTPHGK